MQDYIHLYMGQNVVHVPDDKTTANIHGLDLSAGRVFVNNNDHQMYGELKLSEIKLILRPLESMTDEEVRELIQHDKLREEYRSLVYEFFPDGKRIEIQWSVETEDGAVITNNWTLSLIEMNAHDFAWALKKGFDLFGLRESGLCVYEQDL